MFVEARGLGRVYAAETGFVLRQDPDTVRAPDVSFVSREREAMMPSWRGFLDGAPDLAAEVRSPDDSLSALFQKAGEYLEAGARLVWIVDPLSREIHIHRPDQAVQVLGAGATLEGDSVLPGFTLPLQQLFVRA